jgi:fumarate hydratase class II
MNQPTRIEHDSMGELAVPADALYGAQTQRAVNNFPISPLKMPRAFIRALGFIKASAARANHELKLLDDKMTSAIEQAALAVAEGAYDAHFPIDVFQTGSGTSTNMNANEVISHLANQNSGLKIHPNDHVNMSQSSNDVIPASIHVSAALLVNELLIPACQHLVKTLEKKAKSVGGATKTGRTHLMDAMPVRFEQELNGWKYQIEQDMERIQNTLPRLCQLALGGTAVGTGINAHPDFGAAVAKMLSKQTGLGFVTSPNYFAHLSSQDTAVELSGQLRTLACSLMKISNDLRWMNSGPLAGLGEIALPALQPGSSIMPGKVNPVIPEAVCMVAAQIMGNDTTIMIAGQSGNFQLNVMLPVVAYNLLQSIELAAHSCRVLADSAIEGFTINQQRVDEQLERNPILVTALNTVIGYEKGAAIAKQAYKEGKAIKDVAREQTDLSEADLKRLLDPQKLTEGGIPS